MMHSDRRRFFLTEPDGITDDLSGIRGRVAAGPLTGRRRDARGGPVAQAVHGPHAAGHRDGWGTLTPRRMPSSTSSAPVGAWVRRALRPPAPRAAEGMPPAGAAGPAWRRGGGVGSQNAPTGAVEGPSRGVLAARGVPRRRARAGESPDQPWRAWQEGTARPSLRRITSSPRAVACPLPPGARASFPHAFVYTPGGRPTPHPPERVQRGAEPFPKTLTIPACYDHNILPTG